MARKHGMLKTILTLGGLAAAGVAVYRNRALIRSALSEATGTYAPETPAEDYAGPTEVRFPEKPARDETVIVIDRRVPEAEAE